MYLRTWIDLSDIKWTCSRKNGVDIEMECNYYLRDVGVLIELRNVNVSIELEDDGIKFYRNHLDPSSMNFLIFIVDSLVVAGIEPDEICSIIGFKRCGLKEYLLL